MTLMRSNVPMRSSYNRVLAAVFTLPLLACSNPPEADYNPNTGGTGATSSGATGNTPASGGAGATPSSGGAGGTVTAGTGGTVTAGTGGATAGTGGAIGGTGGAAPGGCPANVMGHCDAAAVPTYPTYPGFTLTLVEDFTEAIDLVNDPIWTYSDGGMPEGDVRFKKENITFEGGMMKL